MTTASPKAGSALLALVETATCAEECNGAIRATTEIGSRVQGLVVRPEIEAVVAPVEDEAHTSAGLLNWAPVGIGRDHCAVELTISRLEFDDRLLEDSGWTNALDDVAPGVGRKIGPAQALWPRRQVAGRGESAQRPVIAERSAINVDPPSELVSTVMAKLRSGTMNKPES